MRSAGIDIGSRTIKLVIADGAGICFKAVADAGYDPLALSERLLSGQRFDRIVATGYGRHLFRSRFPQAEAVTEIRAAALGARALSPGCRTIVDVGGQDTKVIALDGEGRVAKFAMNDRCAAGTGRFLEVMATALSCSPGQFIEAARAADQGEKLSSLCTVFAESEVISLVARGADRGRIALGIHQAIAARTAALAGALVSDGPILFIGGGALNACLERLLASALKRAIEVPADPQLVPALGSALHGQTA